jgi:hypothetical protein
MSYEKMRNYPVGSKVQHTTRYVFVKGSEGKWKSEHRWMAELKLLNRELEEGERVFHKDGVKDNNNPDNLVVIKFSTAKFVPMKKSKVLFIPKVVGGVKTMVEA